MSNAREVAKFASGFATGGFAGFRNRIINGSAIIGQRGTINLTTTAPAYGTDRMLCGVVSGTGINVNLFKSSFGGSSSGLAHYISGSMTGGTPYWCQRIEQMNVVDLFSKNITVSGLMYQDTGSTQQFVARIAKANAADNFAGGVTALQTSAAFSVPSGVVTPFSAIFTLGATDAANGLMLEVFTTAGVTCTSKNFCLTDLQLEKGAIISPSFEFRHAGFELALCKRYFQKMMYLHAVCQSSTVMHAWGAFPVEMRTSPTFAATGVLNFQGDGVNNLTQTAASVGSSNGNASHYYLANIGNFSGLTTGRIGNLGVPGNNGNYVTADAEL